MKLAEGNRGVLVLAGLAILGVSLIFGFEQLQKAQNRDTREREEAEALASRQSQKPEPSSQPFQENKKLEPKENQAAETIKPPSPERKTPPARPREPARTPKYEDGSVLKLQKVSGNDNPFAVWHPKQFENIKEAIRIDDKEGIFVMERDRLLYLFKDGTNCRVLRHVSFDSKDSDRDVYEVRVTEDEACRDRRVNTYGLVVYAYACSLTK